MSFKYNNNNRKKYFKNGVKRWVEVYTPQEK